RAYPLPPRPREEALVDPGRRLRGGLLRFGRRRERQATHEYHRNDPPPACPHQSSSCDPEAVGPTAAHPAPVAPIGGRHGCSCGLALMKVGSAAGVPGATSRGAPSVTTIT